LTALLQRHGTFLNNSSQSPFFFTLPCTWLFSHKAAMLPKHRSKQPHITTFHQLFINHILLSASHITSYHKCKKISQADKKPDNKLMTRCVVTSNSTNSWTLPASSA